MSGEVLGRPDYAIPSKYGHVTSNLPHKISKWEGIVAQVRKDAVARIERGEDPQWAVVAIYTKGGRVQTEQDRVRDRRSLMAYLRRHFRFEAWKLAHRPIPDTWHHRQLLLRFEGFLTEAEADIYWEQRRKAAEMISAKRKRAAKERRVREAAEREQEAHAMRERAIRDRGGRVG